MGRDWFLKIGHGNRLLLVVASSLVFVVIVMMVFLPSPDDRSRPLLGEITIKKPQSAPMKPNTSNYQELRKQQKKVAQNTLRYKERKSAENPFFSFYREATPLNTHKEGTSDEASSAVLHKPQSFFSVVNSDRKREAIFFEAVFEESQQVQDGKALKIVLKDPIPALNLEAGTLLKGVPYLEGGTRLKIRITAAIVGDTVRPVQLVCFDKSDCLEGLYHEELDQQLAGTREGRLLEKVLDLYAGEGESVVRKGKNLVRKFSDLLKVYQSHIVIAQGRALFVALPVEDS